MTQKACNVSHHLEESDLNPNQARRVVISVADGSANKSSTSIPIKIQVPTSKFNKMQQKEPLDTPQSMDDDHIDEPQLLSSEKNNHSVADRSLPDNFAIHIRLA